MNRNLERAIFDLKKVEAMMFAFESTYLDVDSSEEDYEAMDNRQYAFLAIKDAIELVVDDLDRLAADTRIVDVIHAINKKNQQ